MSRFIRLINRMLFDSPWANQQIRRRASAGMEDIVNMWRKEDLDGIHRSLIAPLRWLLPLTVLRKAFAMAFLTCGPVIRCGSPRVTCGIFIKASMPITFQRLQLTMQVYMTHSLRVWTINLRPSTQPDNATWSSPTYMPDQSYEEVKVDLGPRRLRVAGTLTLPPTGQPAPCVIMLSGSGPCDQDSTVGCTKPFKDIALGLARHGVATIRYDKVTYTHKLKLYALYRNFTITDEYFRHAVDAIETARKHPAIDSGSIFVLGHSLGGFVAPRLASTTKINGTILLGASPEPLHHVYLRQLQSFAAPNASSSIVNECLQEIAEQVRLADSPSLTTKTSAKQLPLGLSGSYWLDIRNFNVVEDCKRSGLPTLIVQGGRDYQVTVKDDYEKLRQGLDGIDNFDFQLHPSCNHLFVSGEGPSTPSEYYEQGNVHEEVIKDIAAWVASRKKL